MKIIGFSFIRNAIKYDYPFRESIRSLAGLCDSIVLVVGDSEDDTLAEVEKLAQEFSIEIVRTKWDESKRSGGLILSEQTNIALAKVRELHSKGWAFYLQADEVLLESQYLRIRKDFELATDSNCDVMRFRYLHFWQQYDRIAISKRWYPQEIRALAIDAQEVQSFGDAQSFCNFQRVFESDAFIFHYGHVREAKAYQQKKQDFHKWWHAEEKIAAIQKKGEKIEQKEHSLKYLGPHPICMQDRMRKHQYSSSAVKECCIEGSPTDFSVEFLASIDAEKIHWLNDKNSQKSMEKLAFVSLSEANLWRKIMDLFSRNRAMIPKKMYSPEAREWNHEFFTLLKLSAANIAVKKIK